MGKQTTQAKEVYFMPSIWGICCLRVVSPPDLFAYKRSGNEINMSVMFQTLNNHWTLTICRVSYLSASSPESSHPSICSIGFIFSTMNCLVIKRGWTEQVNTITEPYSLALFFSPYAHIFKNCIWEFIDIWDCFQLYSYCTRANEGSILHLISNEGINEINGNYIVGVFQKVHRHKLCAR